MNRQEVVVVHSISNRKSISRRNKNRRTQLEMLESRVLLTTISINFQDGTSAGFPGYLPDTGLVYANRGNGQTYGWNVSVTADARNRNNPGSPDERWDTLIHMQLTTTKTWEIALANGNYEVHLVAGDPNFTDSIHSFNVEGIFINDSDGLDNWDEFTTTVTVTDGKLTLSPTGTNTKICFIDITDIPTPVGNVAPGAPVITEPSQANQVVSGFDVHMEIGAFFDLNPGDLRSNTDWEIWTTTGSPVRVWSALAQTGTNDHHIHFGDGTFEGPQAGKGKLEPNTTYQLRVRQRDNSGDPLTNTSPYSTRNFVTANEEAATAPGWVAQQPGYVIEELPFTFAHTDGGWRLPTNIVFVPENLHQNGPNDPLFYVMELYGSIKVVTNSFQVKTYATGLLNYNPVGPFGGVGENGSTGLVVDPVNGDLYATMLYDDLTDSSTDTFPKVVKFTSSADKLSAISSTDILKMPGEPMRQSHIISNITFGPDDKLYVHVGDGFDQTKGQNLESFRGKVLRINRDGTPVTTNPFYEASTITARDYVFAYGLRNPFGGAWREANPGAGMPAQHFMVENGPSRDRFTMLVQGQNYLYDGSDASMINFNIAYASNSGGANFPNGEADWAPAPAPVNITFVQNSTFSGSGFPASKIGHAFVTLSGPTYASGPNFTKSIQEWVLTPAGARDATVNPNPRELISYEGAGRSTAAAIAAGPDGLYFSTLYPDTGNDPTALGAKVLRVRYVGVAAPTVQTAASATPNPVTGTSTNVSVLGADDLAESTLEYTWSVVSKPAGAPDPTFTVNGSNAAKNSTANFTYSGNYVLRVTITDAANNTISSDTASISVTFGFTGITGGTSHITYSGGTIYTVFADTGSVNIANDLSAGGKTVNLTVANGATATLNASQNLAAINIGTGSLLQMPANAPARVIGATSLTIAAAGALDLFNNDMVIDYGTNAAPTATIETYLMNGRNNGSWNGSGIRSTSVAANPSLYAMNSLNNNESATPYNTFNGINTSSHKQVLIRYSYIDDIDLDGKIHTNDAISFATFYSEGQPGNHYHGDLNYDGIVNANDAILFATSYNESLPQIASLPSLTITPLAVPAAAAKPSFNTSRSSLPTGWSTGAGTIKFEQGPLFISATSSAKNGVTLKWRAQAKGPTYTLRLPQVKGPVTLKMERVGNIFTAYYSQDGNTWTKIGTSKTLKLQSTPLTNVTVMI